MITEYVSKEEYTQHHCICSRYNPPYPIGQETSQRKRTVFKVSQKNSGDQVTGNYKENIDSDEAPGKPCFKVVEHHRQDGGCTQSVNLRTVCQRRPSTGSCRRIFAVVHLWSNNIRGLPSGTKNEQVRVQAFSTGTDRLRVERISQFRFRPGPTVTILRPSTIIRLEQAGQVRRKLCSASGEAESNQCHRINDV